MYVKTFKRYRMEINLRQHSFPVPKLPPDYYAEQWSRNILESHATAHYLAFRDEIDAELFENFRTFRGACRVMENIANNRGFYPEATWLIVYHPKNVYMPERCASIQGLIDVSGNGAIQNVGVIPNHRHRGLGHCLLGLALHGYQMRGIHYANLEVTAENATALQLYQSMGFQITQVLQKLASTPSSQRK